MASSNPTAAKNASKRVAEGHDPSISPPPLKRKTQSAISSKRNPPVSSPASERRGPWLYPLADTQPVESAVASFFTPTSQKPKDRTMWSERSPETGSPATLLVAKYVPEDFQEGPEPKRRKIAAFDLVR